MKCSENVMVLRVYFAFFCSLQLSGSAGRSISVVVKHRHTFAVDDVRETQFIQLPEDVEAELKFEPRTTKNHVKDLPTNQTTKDTNKNGSLSRNKSSINKVLMDRLNMSTNADRLKEIARDRVNQVTENDESLIDDRPNDDYNYEDDNDETVENGEKNDQNIMNDDQYTDGFDDDNGVNYDFENDRTDDVDRNVDEDDDLAVDDDDDTDDEDTDDDNTDDEDTDDYYYNTDNYISDNDDIYHANNEATNLDAFRYKDKKMLKNKRASGGKDFVAENERKTQYIQTDNNFARGITEEEAKIKRLYDLTERKRRAVDKMRKPRNVGQGEDIPDSDIWEDVTDEELEAVQRQQYIRLAKYIGWTLLSVIFFVLVGICFLRDPITCIFSFGTGCPCFLIICPCVRGFVNKYLNVKKMVQDAMNKYTPGVIVNDDGTIQHYEPTAEEVALLKDLLDEITGQTLI